MIIIPHKQNQKGKQGSFSLVDLMIENGTWSRFLGFGDLERQDWGKDIIFLEICINLLSFLGQQKIMAESDISPHLKLAWLGFAINKIKTMKALMKPQSSQYFRRYQKPKQDPQITMNNIQAKKISQAVGIDTTQTKQFSWFFELITKLKLPQNYTRYLSPNKDEVVYFNEVTHEESIEHPSINILKILFYETLANNKAIYTFVDKQSKLLPFVEEKMLRQSIGLNSKRREAEKVNLQRDESGRMVMSKLEKINPDFKALLASRSYMLKMLVEKVFTRKEIVGKGKRANAFLSIIAQYRQMMKQTTPEKEDLQIINQQNLALYQSIFETAAQFYWKEFKNLNDIPAEVVNSREYLECTPENVLKNTFLLNIDKENIQLYWLARMMDCLPLPPNWSKKKGTSFDSYLYQPQKMLFDIHPSYIYIMHQLNQFKSIFKELGSIQQNYYLNMRQLNFFDFFQRRYTVDMYGYIENAQKSNVKVENSKEKASVKVNQTSDWMVLEGIKNTSMTPQAFILAEIIQQFWDSLDFKEEAWCPAVSPYGEVVWSSNVNYKSISFNPYRSKLSSIVKTEMKKLPTIRQEDLKAEYQAQSQQKEEEQLVMNVDGLYKERQDFLTYYLSHQDRALPWPYQLKPHFSLLDESNYFDQIFVSPFDLDQGLIKEGEAVPFWLEKARAKKHIIEHTNLLIFNGQDFLSINAKIAAYALDMTGQHQPHLLEQTEKKINRISNPEDLLKFLNYTNDLDMREQRKRDYLQSLRQASIDSDIFGSEISQVEVQERMQEDSAEEVEEQKKPIEEEVKEPSVHEKSVHEVSDHSLDEEVIQVKDEVIQEIKYVPRQEYEFLNNFPKKKYFKRGDLSWVREQETQKQLLKQIKHKSKKCKYKRGIIHQKVKREITKAYGLITNDIYIAEQQSAEQRKHRKKNLATTHLRSDIFPYQIQLRSKVIKARRNSKEQSQDGCSEITQYSQFQSQVDDYDSQEVQELIQEIRKNRKPLEIYRAPTERSFNEHEQTTDTIELEPIHQIKPEIHLDPVLRHVKKVSSELLEFRSTFNAKVPKTVTPLKDPHRDNIRKSDSQKSLPKETAYSSTPNPLRNSSLKKLDMESRLSFVRKEGMGGLRHDLAKPFHRVCLEKTASHFLEKQAFLRKGDLITMQARKSLLSKGRGLETYISKFY